MLDAILANADKARSDLAALHVAQSIQEVKLNETGPKALVIDFFRDSAGNFLAAGDIASGQILRISFEFL